MIPAEDDLCAGQGCRSRRKLLITGGAGFIGSSLVRRAVAKGYNVVVVDALTYAGNIANLSDVLDDARVVFEQIDIRDGPALKRVFAAHGPDAVMHLAAESHVDRSIDDPIAFVDTNVVGTVRLLQAALGHWKSSPPSRCDAFRFHHVSTDEVYGALCAQGRFVETTPYSPRSPYAASKAASDHFVRAWAETYGLPVVLTNCSNNYGPYHHPEKLIPRTIIAGLLGRPIEVYGTGENVRDWLHVEDHVAALLSVLEAGRIGETYNIGGDGEARNIDIVHQICAELDRMKPASAPHDRLIVMVPDRPGHDFRYAIDAAKIRAELGWRPEIALKDGLRRTVAWYVENEAWWRAVREDGATTARLGLGG